MKKMEANDLEARKERLWEHLKAMEQQVGMPLRKKRRDEYVWLCPIVGYAPNVDAEGRLFVGVGMDGEVIYRHAPIYPNVADDGRIYSVFEIQDSRWWDELPFLDKKTVWKWLEKKMREKGNDNG